MNKRLTALILALNLSLALAVPAAAADITVPEDAAGSLSFTDATGWLFYTDESTGRDVYIVPSTGKTLKNVAGFLRGCALTASGDSPVYGENNAFGLVSASGDRIVPEKYAQIEFLPNGLIAAARLAGGARTTDVYTSAGTAVGENFTAVDPVSGELIRVVTSDGLTGLMDASGSFVAEPGVYSSVGVFSDGLALAVRDGRSFYIDSAGVPVLDFTGYYTAGFSEGLAVSRELAAGDDAPAAYVDATGELILDPVYYEPGSFKYGLAGAAAEPSAALGIMDKTGKFLTEPLFLTVDVLSPDLVDVTLPENTPLHGVYSVSAGKLLLPAEFTTVSIENGLIMTSIATAGGSTAHGVFTLTGEPLVPTEYDDIALTGGFFVARLTSPNAARTDIYTAGGVELDSLEGAFDTELLSPDLLLVSSGSSLVIYGPGGAVLDASDSTGVTALTNGGLILQRQDRRGNVTFDLYSPEGELIKDKLKDLTVFSDTLTWSSGGRFALYDLGGDKLSADYTELRAPANGFYVVKKTSRFGCIDAAGDEIVSPQYSRATDFSPNGLAIVKKTSGAWGTVDTTGEFTAFDKDAFSFTDVGPAFYGSVTVAVAKGGLLGLVSDTGEVLLPAEYQDITPLDPFGYRFALRLPKSQTVTLWENPALKAESFPDVSEDWMLAPVEYVYSHGGLMAGSYGLFDPDRPLDLGTTLTVLARLMGVDTTVTGSQEWYDPGMDWGRREGLTDSTDHAAPVTRQELIYMLWTALGKPAPRHSWSSLYSDSSLINAPCRPALDWAIENGIINGTGANNLSPANTLTRSHLSAFIQRSMTY